MPRYMVALREYQRKPIHARIGYTRYVVGSTDFTEISHKDYLVARRAQDRFFLRVEDGIGVDEMEKKEPIDYKEPEKKSEPKLPDIDDIDALDRTVRELQKG